MEVFNAKMLVIVDMPSRVHAEGLYKYLRRLTPLYVSNDT